MKRIHKYIVEPKYNHIILFNAGINYAYNLYDLIDGMRHFVIDYPHDLKVNESFDFGDFTVTKIEE